MGSIWDRPKGEGACQLSTVGEGAPGEGGADSPVSWSPADTRSANWHTGVPIMANSSSWSPSHSRWTA